MTAMGTKKETGDLYYSVGFHDIPATELGMLAHGGDLHSLQKNLPINWKAEKVALLHAAIHGGSYEVVRFLIEHGAPVDSQAFSDAYHFNKKIFELLQESNPDYELETLNANDILLDAVRSGDTAVARWALSKNAEVDAKDDYGFPGWTGLHHACLLCNRELIDMFLSHGGGVHVQTHDAQTPIMLCVSSPLSKISRQQRKECVSLLIASGAQLSDTVDWFSRLLAKQGFYIPYSRK